MTPTDSTTAAVEQGSVPPPVQATVDLLGEPTPEEITGEWNRYYDDLKAGRLNNVNVPGGHYFAYYGGQILDHDSDFVVLQHRAAAKIGVHWARLVIRYCHPWI